MTNYWFLENNEIVFEIRIVVELDCCIDHVNQQFHLFF